MSLLNEIKIRAKYDGSCALEWSTLRSCLSGEGCLENMPGKHNLEKLKIWAERSGMLIDIEVEILDFTSDIRSVSFWPNPEAVATPDGGQTAAAVAHFHWNQANSYESTTAVEQSPIFMPSPS